MSSAAHTARRWSKSARRDFRKALRQAAKPSWRRCFWTRPLGHDWLIHNGCEMCEWCGKPRYASASEFDLIRAAERATGVDLDEGLVAADLVAAWRKS